MKKRTPKRSSWSKMNKRVLVIQMMEIVLTVLTQTTMAIVVIMVTVMEIAVITMPRFWRRDG